MLRIDYDLRVPLRRTIPCPAGPGAVEAAADPYGRLRRNVAITPIDIMVPAKVKDTPFFPRIPDGGIAPVEIAISVIVIRKERKS